MVRKTSLFELKKIYNEINSNRVSKNVIESHSAAVTEKCEERDSQRNEKLEIQNRKKVFLSLPDDDNDDVVAVGWTLMM